jgi:VWFA-related protein
MRRAACVLFVGLAGLSLHSRAQQASQPQATFQSGVDVVQVDVSVLDKDRRPVRGLTTADFTILEDGKPRPIVAFTAVDLPAAPAPTQEASWTRDVPADAATNDINGEGRLVVIMLDRTIGLGDEAIRARRVGAAAIEQLAPGDLAAVVYTVNRAKPQNFTSDRARLLKAIESHAHGTEMELAPGLAPTTSGACYCGLCVPEAITYIAEALQDVPQRRKSLLFIGRGLSIDRPIPPYIEIAFVGSGLWQECVIKLKDSRKKMFEAAARANLTISTFDPGGLDTLTVKASANVIRLRDVDTERSAIRDSTQLRQDSLRVLAEQTGGRAVLNTNNPFEIVPTIFEESSSYYVLGFQSADQARNGRAHKIEVKVNRRGVDVRTRSGFTTPAGSAPVTTANTAAPPLANAVKDLLPKTGLQLSAVAMPFASRDASGHTVFVALNVQQTKIEPAPTGPEHVEIFAGAFDREGRSPGWLRQAVDVGAPDASSGTLQYGAVSVLRLRPGTYEIRVGAEHREAARTGSVYTYVEVPDFAKEPLSMSAIVLGGGSATVVTPTDDFGDLIPFVPTSRRVFARTETVPVFARVYQGGEGAMSPVAARVRVVDAAAKGVFGGGTTLPLEEFDVNRSAPFRLDVPLQRLVPGEYLLTLEATLGTRNARRDVRFTVR